MGGLHEELGEMAEAEAAFRAALGLQPRFALPHARLATLLRGKLPDADLAALEERLADPQAQRRAARRSAVRPGARPGRPRANYARAADCLREANALTLELASAATTTTTRPSTSSSSTACSKATSIGFLPRTAGAGLDTRRPVFVFGLPRSGTTLIEQVLASHPHPRRRRAAPGPPVVRGHPRPAGPYRVRRWTACRTSTRRRSAAWPSSTSTGCDGRRRPGRADRGQDAGQLPVSRPAGGPVSPGRTSSTAAATCATWPSRAG